HGDELPDRPCCSLDSVNDARRVCDQLGIPHYVLNLEKAFGRDVVDDFVNEYASGRTPIPCVRCNTFTKFRDLVAKADPIDASVVRACPTLICIAASLPRRTSRIAFGVCVASCSLASSCPWGT